MHHFFVPIEQIGEGGAVILGDDVSHIRNVLRLEGGDEILLSDGQGQDYYCIIKNMQTDKVELEIKEIKPVEAELPVKIVLFQALPKSDKMEWIIQKAVELGVNEIVPVRTRRCVVKLDDKKAEKKVQRWQGIAESAAKQSGRGIIPKIHKVLSFLEAVELAKEYEAVLIPYELCESMNKTRQAIQESYKMNSIAVFIGPEGGFERGEVERAVTAGAKEISLGKRILRTETAGMTVLSVLMFQIETERGI